MLSRRMVTFLIGAWLGGGILVSVLVLQNLSFAEALLRDPSDGAKILFIKVGEEDSRLMLRYAASEQNRAYLFAWERAQLVTGPVMVALLFLSAPRRILPIALTALMLALVLFQHFGVTPELTFRGRQADFLSDDSSFSVRARIDTLNRMYGGAEAAKIIVGGFLASYLFAASSAVSLRRKKRVARETG